jgi:hypothetical protein
MEIKIPYAPRKVQQEKKEMDDAPESRQDSDGD